MERVKMAAEKLEKAVDEMNVAEQRFMCQFDTIEQLYFEKEKLYLEKLSEAQDRYEKAEERNKKNEEAIRKHYLKIILAIAIPFVIFLSTIIGGAIYLLSNYDIGFQTYQEVYAEGGGDATNEDGIHFGYPPYGVDD